jgi:tRNA G18 (ribose-2'-O)-methylase SpoU
MDRKLLNSELGRISAGQYRELPESGVVLVLDNIRSAHNVGSAFRTSDAFKVDRIVLCGICAVPPSAEIHKSALGAEDSVPWEHVDDTLEAVAQLRSEGYRIVAVEQTENSVKLGEFRPVPGERYALIFGNEVDGVQQSVVDASDFALEIPQYGTKHSLNVSVSVGVVLWEFCRQGR